jgi:hypothetical protein
MSSTLYNLDVPDEQTELDLKDAEPKEIILECYKTWMAEWHKIENPQSYGLACRILKPFSRRIWGNFNADDLPKLDDKVYGYTPLCIASGVYLAALLNETDIRQIEFGNYDDRYCWFEDFIDENSVETAMTRGKRIYAKTGQ